MLTRLAVLIATTAGLVAAQDQAAKQIDEIFQQWNKRDVPGAAVAVIQDGKLVFQKGYGIANLEYGIPITPETVFHVASVSKQFTAMALVLLEQDGKLSLEDDVHKYLTELPDYGRMITIRNLLQHTSGVRDQWQTLSLAGWRMDDVITQKQILRMMFRQKELNFAPGSEHLYSNGGYTLAAEIVHRVSGKSLGDFCEERIFKPLDMTHTHFHEDHQRLVPNRAYSYSPRDNGYVISPLNYANVGATSLFTTAPDLVRWLDNFRIPKVGGRAAIDRLEERAVLSSGKQIDYALGVVVGTYRGLKTVSHSGGDAGYRSHVLWFPGEQLGIAVLSNSGNFNPGQIANKVAAVFAGPKMSAEVSKPKSGERQFTTIDPAKLDRYPGTYRLEAGLIVNIEKRGDKLVAAPLGQPSLELKPLGENRFYVTPPINAEIEFAPRSDGKMTFKLIPDGGSPMPAEPITLAKFEANDLPQYPGIYWSDELETQYTLTAKDGQLVAGHPHHLDIQLRPIAKDRFSGNQWFFSEASFTRDASGKVVGMTVGGGRVRGIHFVRK